MRLLLSVLILSARGKKDPKAQKLTMNHVENRVLTLPILPIYPIVYNLFRVCYKLCFRIVNVYPLTQGIHGHPYVTGGIEANVVSDSSRLLERDGHSSPAHETTFFTICATNPLKHCSVVAKKHPLGL